MFLPLFPLEIVVFPGEIVPLHIFEPRYKQLIGECRDEGITFGITPVIEGRPARFGTEIGLTKILRTYPDGEMDIVTQGLTVFRIREIVPDVPEKLYAGGEVDLIENDAASDPELRNRVAGLFNDLQRIAQTNRRADPEQEGNFSFELGHHVGFGAEDKIRLLALASETDRLTFLLEHLERAVPHLDRAMKDQKKAGGNGHAKHFPRDN